MDGGIFQRGEQGKEMRGAYNMRSSILFSFKAEFKLARTGCIKSSFLPNSMPGCPVLWQISSAVPLHSELWPWLTDVRLITAYGALDWPDRLATKITSEEMAKPHLEMTEPVLTHAQTQTHKHAVWDWGLQLPYKLMRRTLQFLSSVTNYTPSYNSVYLETE